MNATHEKLKPCPCCGGSAELIKGYAAENVWPHGEFHRVFCGACQLRQLFHRTPEAAIAAWNKRAQHAGEAREPTACEPIHANADGWCDWQFPIHRGYKMACCDCGLVHDVEFDVTKIVERYADGSWRSEDVEDADYRVAMRMKREDAAAPVAAMSDAPPAGER